MKKSNDTIGNRTRDLPVCRAVPQPTAPPRAPHFQQYNFKYVTFTRNNRSQCLRGLRHWSAAALLLGLRVRIPPEAWMCVTFECWVCCQVEVSTTGRSLVRRSPTVCGMSEIDLETSEMRRYRPTRAVKR